jgi:transcription initiation factor IIF auxiliary subunit
LPHDIYIVHTARHDPALDACGQEYYRLRIFMDADESERLDDVAEVTYRLHPTFRDPIRKVTDRRSNFELRTAAWGEFNMTAEIRFKGGDKLVVERYINLPGTSA